MISLLFYRSWTTFASLKVEISKKAKKVVGYVPDAARRIKSVLRWFRAHRVPREL